MMQYQQPTSNPENMSRPLYLPGGCSPLNLSSRGRRTREYLDTHKNVEKKRRDRINNCLETIRQCLPPCQQIPSARRLEKGEILDMTISYLQLVNHFLAGIGIQDVYSASKQQVNLYQGIDNWIHEHHSNYDSVSEFTKDLKNLLENEIDTMSTQLTIEQTWSSRKTVTSGESLFLEDRLDVKTESLSSESTAADIRFDNGLPSVRPGSSSSSNTVTIKQECPDPATISSVKKFKFSNLVEGVIDGAMSARVSNNISDKELDGDRKKSEMVSVIPQSNKISHPIVRIPSVATPPAVITQTQTSCHCSSTKDPRQRTNNNTIIPSSESNPNSSIGGIEIQTSAGSITIPIRLGMIQIEAPPEMLQPLRQACIRPIVFNAQLQSTSLPSGAIPNRCSSGPIPNKCSCGETPNKEPLTVQITESTSDHCYSGKDQLQARMTVGIDEKERT